jgi:hypothetical protein
MTAGSRSRARFRLRTFLSESGSLGRHMPLQRVVLRSISSKLCDRSGWCRYCNCKVRPVYLRGGRLNSLARAASASARPKRLAPQPVKALRLSICTPLSLISLTFSAVLWITLRIVPLRYDRTWVWRLFRRVLESDDEPVGSRDVFHSLIGEPKRITLPSGSVCEPSRIP